MKGDIDFGELFLRSQGMIPAEARQTIMALGAIAVRDLNAWRLFQDQFHALRSDTSDLNEAVAIDVKAGLELLAQCVHE